MNFPQSLDRHPAEELPQELYQRAIAAIGTGVIIINATRSDHPIIYCNSAFEQLTGYCASDVLGRDCCFLQGADTDPTAVAQIEAALREKRSCQVVWKNYRQDGRAFWNELTISPVRDEIDRVTHFIGVQVDVTHYRQGQIQLERPSAAIEAVMDDIAIPNQKGEYIYLNEPNAQNRYNSEEIIGKSWENDILERRVSKRTLALCKVIKRLRGEMGERKQAEEALRQQAEREKLVGAIAQRIRQSLNLSEVLNTTVEEVRQFLQTDRVVLYRFESNWSGAAVVESVSKNTMPILGIEIEDPCFGGKYVQLYHQGRIRAIDDIHASGLSQCHIDLLAQFQVRANLVVPILQNHPKCQLPHFKTEEIQSEIFLAPSTKLWGLLIAHHCSDTRKWQESELELLRQLSVQIAIAIQQSELYQQLENQLDERQQAEAALRQREAQLCQKTGELEQTLRELQQTQAQLVQSEKMSSLGQLVAGVAHEINNPINFIYGNITPAKNYIQDLLELLELYQEYCPSSSGNIQEKTEEIDLEFILEDLPKLLESMQTGAERIREIVRSLRYFSHLDEAERKAVDLHEGLDSTLLILQNRLKARPERPAIEVIREYGDLPLVECYGGQLNQVFMNILNNAIDALEESEQKQSVSVPVGGRASTKTKPKSSTIRIKTEIVDGARIAIRIADNGPGITEEVRRCLFDPFFTTKPVGKGTGLGLSISYQIVVEKHGGQIYCFSEPGEGTEFAIEIPMQLSDG